MAGWDVTHPTHKPNPNPHFPLLQLPAELRQRVLDYLLDFSGVLRLQNEAARKSTVPGCAVRRSELDLLRSWGLTPHHRQANFRQQHWFPCIDGALLRTCRTLYYEAGLYFYGKNHFNIPALTGGLESVISQNAFICALKRVSIDYSYTYPKYSHNRAHHVDNTMAICIQQLAKACPRLQVLTIQICPKQALLELLLLARGNKSSTIKLIRSLKLRLERITIVTSSSACLSIGQLIVDETMPLPATDHKYRKDWPIDWRYYSDCCDNREWPGLIVPKELFDPLESNRSDRCETEAWRPDHRECVLVWHSDGSSSRS